MSHLPRLFRVASVVARYRLGEFLRSLNGVSWLKFSIGVLTLPWKLLPAPGSNRNERLRLALEELGPIYIKFGQLLSTRPDFLDAELAEELQSLQDNVPPFSTPAPGKIIEDALGSSIDEVFTELDTVPFASASVAQVHKGLLKSGEEVVVKIIRPGIEKTITADIRLLKWMARMLQDGSDLGKRLRPVEVVADYEKVIFNELNLLMEAANTSQLRRNFENSSVLYVPRVYWEHTRQNVLVMERIHGIPVTDVPQLEQSNVNLKKLAETGVDIFFTQVFEHNFFHADMHPGNIFVARENPDNPKYIAIDCAIIGSLSDDDQEYLAKNLLAIFKQDYRRVAELHVACGWVPKDTPISDFEAAMRSVCEPVFEKPLKDISFGQLLLQLFRTAGRFNMEVQPSLVLLQKTLLNIEGLGRQLYPELDLWQTAMPYLENWNSKRLNPFTLLSRIQENIPNWIEQIPELPELIIETAFQSKKLTDLNERLIDQQQQNRERQRKRARRARSTGKVLLALALVSLLPGFSQYLSQMPLVTLLLGAGGVYLLSFKA